MSNGNREFGRKVEIVGNKPGSLGDSSSPGDEGEPGKIESVAPAFKRPSPKPVDPGIVKRR